MFTQNSKRSRGRPKGTTKRGFEAKKQLYRTAIRLFAERGYDRTTLRDIAKESGVSPGLLYRYFPSKSAVVLELYDALSMDLEKRSRLMRPGPWRERALFALESSLAVLGPHRSTLAALIPVLIADSERGVFSDLTKFSRARVERVFLDAALGAREKLARRDGEALGRLLYLLHLAVILWWLLDKSPGEAATRGLLALIRRLAPAASLAFRLPRTRTAVRQMDELVRSALY